jgi:DNA-binding transcriptional regulator YdaS (Cro superfamily)
MDLLTYLSAPGRGSSLARDLAISPVLISQWRNGIRPVPAERCPAIERATGGAVRCEDLRPDVDWAVLRGTVTAEQAA